ncbi:polyketide synthase dehydratase domain-containing protein, partial [Kitasatospora sp. NPDC001159]
GTTIQWTTLLPTPHTLPDLPTYPFQHQHYWLTAPDTATPGDFGLAAAEHPLLGAIVELADVERTVFSGRLSVASQPWLADHAVMGSVLMPAAMVLEMFWHAGHRLDAPRVAELTLEAPLVIGEQGVLTLQLVVSAPDGTGHRTASLHSRPAQADSDEPWTRHATGVLTSAEPAPAEDLAAWPPAGATALAAEGLYDRLAERGFDYGPAFRGLRQVWQRGDELFAEVALPDQAAAVNGFALSPMLLDAALHTLLVQQGDTDVRLPFAWSGASLYATGADALRIRVTTAEGGDVALLLADESGAPVASVEALAVRPVTAEQLAAASGGQDPLFEIEWAPAGPAVVEQSATVLDGPLAALAERGAVPATVFARVPATDEAGDTTPTAAHRILTSVLTMLQEWLAEERFAGSRLVLVTRNAVPVHEHEPVDPA